jgi:hypothetical protein
MSVREQTWDVLAAALDEIVYTRDVPPGKRFQLARDDEANYAVLYIFTLNPNTYRPEQMRHTRHEFVVPVATYNKENWIRWVFERIAGIEMHETCESFQVNGVRIYAPHHGNGEDPYVVWHLGTPEQAAKAPGEA